MTPSSVSERAAACSGARLPKSPLTITYRRAPVAASERPMSVAIAVTVSGASDTVPGYPEVSQVSP